MGDGLQRAFRAAKTTRTRYLVQRFIGLTDGKPSWRRVASVRDPELAQIALARIAWAEPEWKLRIRKVAR